MTETNFREMKDLETAIVLAAQRLLSDFGVEGVYAVERAMRQIQNLRAPDPVLADYPDHSQRKAS